MVDQPEANLAYGEPPPDARQTWCEIALGRLTCDWYLVTDQAISSLPVDNKFSSAAGIACESGKRRWNGVADDLIPSDLGVCCLGKQNHGGSQRREGLWLRLGSTGACPRPYARSLTFFSGSERTGLPVAANIAFITAGAATAIVGSPTPPQNPPDGTVTVSTTFGKSAMRMIA